MKTNTLYIITALTAALLLATSASGAENYSEYLALRAEDAPEAAKSYLPSIKSKKAAGKTIRRSKCGVSPFERFEYTPYGPEEGFHYKGYILGVYAGDVTVRLGKPEKDNTIPIILSAETNSFFSKVKRLVSKMTSFVRTDTYLPSRAFADAQVGDRRNITEVRFDSERSRYSGSVKRNTAKAANSISGRMNGELHDVLSVFLNFRMKRLQKGDELCAEYLYDRRIWRVQGKIVGFEKVSVPAGVFEAAVFEGTTFRASRANNKESHRPVKIWISADERRIIVKGSSDLALGKAVMELNDYRPPAMKKKIADKEASVGKTKDMLCQK